MSDYGLIIMDNIRKVQTDNVRDCRYFSAMKCKIITKVTKKLRLWTKINKNPFFSAKYEYNNIQNTKVLYLGGNYGFIFRFW